MEAVRLAHAKGWEEAELTGLAAQVAARMRTQLTKAERAPCATQGTMTKPTKSAGCCRPTPFNRMATSTER